MSSPKPDKWSDLLRPTYRYPDDLTEGSAAGLSGRSARRAGRRAKKQWRKDDHAARRDFLAAERGKEPPSSEGRLGVVVLLALVVAVVTVGGVVRSCTTNDAPPPAVSESTEPAPTTQPETTAPAPATPTTSPTSTATQSATEAPVATSEPVTPQDPDAIAVAWATGWNTYAPTDGDTNDARLARIAEISSPQLLESMTVNDQTSLYYDTERTDLSVQSVVVVPMPEGAAPVDTDLRMTRRVTATTVTTADPGAPQLVTYDLTIERPDPTTSWRVSYVADVVSGDG